MQNMAHEIRGEISIVKSFSSSRISATPPGCDMVLPGSGGVARAQPPANFWQPSGLAAGALEVVSGPVTLSVCSPHDRLHREAVVEISRGLSGATPPENVPHYIAPPQGARHPT